MMATRNEIARSVEATSPALARLTPPQLEQVRQDTNKALLEFIQTEWIPVKTNGKMAL